MLLDSSDSSGAAGAALAGMGVVFAVVGIIELAAMAFMIYLYTRIARKAGYPQSYGLLMLIPVANIVFIILFAFKEWPIEQRLRGAWPPAGGGYGPGAYGPGGGYGAAVSYQATPSVYPGYATPQPVAPTPYGSAPSEAAPAADAPPGAAAQYWPTSAPAPSGYGQGWPSSAAQPDPREPYAPPQP